MRKAVSADYNIFAQAAGKTVHWRVSMKQTADITELQSAGTWIDVTDHLDSNTPQRIDDKTELSFGQFTSSSLMFTGYDIAWWKANIFNVSAINTSIEMKVEFWLNDLTADTIVMFGGWVDWKKDQFCVKYTESKDSVDFTVFGYQEMGERISAAGVLFQPLDSSGRLILLNIPGITVSNANITSYVLKKGYHTLTYQFIENLITQIKLDNGEFVPTPDTDGTIELINEDGTQKIDLFVDVSQLIYSSTDLTQDVVVLTEGTTIPQVWLQRSWVFTVLKKLWAKIGITQLSFDNFQIKTYDNRWTTSYYDVPPDNVVYAKPRCIKYDVTNDALWIGIGDKIYKRSMVDHSYTYIGQAAAGYNVLRFFTEQSASNKIWGLARSASYAYKIFRITPSTGALSSWTLTHRGSGDTSNTGCLNFALASGYGTAGVMFYCSTSGDQKVWYFNFNTLAEVDATYSTGHAPEYILAGWSDGTNYFYQETIGVGTVRIVKLWDTGSGWLADEKLGGASTSQIEDGAYNVQEAKYIHSRIGGNGVYSYDHAADTITTITASGGGGNYEYAIGIVYLTRFAGGSPPKMALVNNGWVYEYPEAVVYPFAADGVAYPCGATMDVANGRYLGLFATSWILFQFSYKIAMYIDCEANYADMTVIDAIKELCAGFNLRPRTASIKKAYALRRIDDAGNIISSGQSVTLNADTARDVSEESGYIDAYDMVIVDNGSSQESYDGSNFGVLGMLGEKTMTVNNRFIPTRLLKDYAYWFYQFFKNTCKRYMVPTPLIPFFQYEPFDGANLYFTNKVKIATAPELVVNGGFDTDTVWVYNWGSGVYGWSIRGGKANYDGTGWAALIQYFILQTGKTYLIQFDKNGGDQLFIYPGSGGSYAYYGNDIGHIAVTLVADGPHLAFGSGTTYPFSVDNFSCKEVGNLSGPAQGIIDGQSIARNGETEFEVII